ncbi:helix-turn-helix transcriptional regulator [Oryzifoliimicrobium ureilyticus]|uniref:helix-turn-helix transcriptional regulator n=1 Tax=Oryzifoliimicrobium ureilyticus TaxID=3113724 RepID=UPI0030763573
MTVRFPVYGSIVRRDSRGEYNFDNGHGLIAPFRGMESMRTSANVSLVNCSFGHEMMLRYMRSLDGDDSGRNPSFNPLVDTRLPAVGIFRAALLALHERIQRLDPGNDLFFPILEEMLVFQLIGCWPRQTLSQIHRLSASNKVLRAALEYIDANLSKPVGVSEVARAAGTSVRSVQIAFKRNLGVTPVQYIINSRLDRVHDALKQDHAPGYISQIAHMWGFYHPADFARRYKARFGETPSESRVK